MRGGPDPAAAQWPWSKRGTCSRSDKSRLTLSLWLRRRRISNKRRRQTSPVHAEHELSSRGTWRSKELSSEGYLDILKIFEISQKYLRLLIRYLNMSYFIETISWNVWRYLKKISKVNFEFIFRYLYWFLRYPSSKKDIFCKIKK